MNEQQTKADLFRMLHTSSETFIMPNAWDGGSARLLAAAGFKALGTTSAGIAFSLGLPDSEGSVSRTEMMQRITQITQSIKLPVSADLESGYGITPTEVAETIQQAIQAGAIGGNIEDYTGRTDTPLFERDLAIDRIQAARQTADQHLANFTLTARTDCYLVKQPNTFKEAIERANAYHEAGADCIFIPGVRDPDLIGQLVRAIAAPLTVVMGLTDNYLTVNQLADLGVRRISIGGSLARATYGLMRQAAQEMLENGTFSYANQQIPDNELCDFFANYPETKLL